MLGRLSTIKRIEYSPYFLQPKQARKRREGALLKVEFEDCVGYADCHPWTEIGDEPLHSQLLKLSLRLPTHLCKQALEWAFLDAKARKEKKSLLSAKDIKCDQASELECYHYSEIPKSHFLILHLDDSTPQLLEKGLKSGFERFKLKLNCETCQKIEALKFLAEKCEKSQAKIRLDLNENLNRFELENFLSKISSFKSCIEYIEDPFPFHPEDWKSVAHHYGIQFACDVRAHYKTQDLNQVPIIVVKPAIYSLNKIQELAHSKVVLTSYVAHPLEQMVAAYAATSISKKYPERVVQAGLLSHKVYKKNAFSECLLDRGPFFFPPEGSGFGFDVLLEQQKWIKLWAHSK